MKHSPNAVIEIEVDAYVLRLGGRSRNAEEELIVISGTVRFCDVGTDMQGRKYRILARAMQGKSGVRRNAQIVYVHSRWSIKRHSGIETITRIFHVVIPHTSRSCSETVDGQQSMRL